MTGVNGFFRVLRRFDVIGLISSVFCVLSGILAFVLCSVNIRSFMPVGMTFFMQIYGVKIIFVFAFLFGVLALMFGIKGWESVMGRLAVLFVAVFAASILLFVVLDVVFLMSILSLVINVVG